MNEVYGAWLEGVDIKPTRAAFAVDALPAGLVEIVVQAVKVEMPGSPYLMSRACGPWPRLLRVVLPAAACVRITACCSRRWSSSRRRC